MSGRSGDRRAAWWLPVVAVGGAAGAALATHDWTSTPLGALSTWPQGLRGAVTMCLPSRFPMAVWWGPESVLIHNDAYAEIFAGAHGDAFGRPAAELRPDVHGALGGHLATVRDGGRATRSPDEPVLLRRNGSVEWCLLTSCFSPILGVGGRVDGVLTVVTETTRQAVGAPRSGEGALSGVQDELRRSLRQAEALSRLSAALSAADTAEEVARATVTHLADVFDAARTRLGLLDPRHPVLQVVAGSATGPPVRADELPLDGDDLLAVTVREDAPASGSAPDGAVAVLTVPLRYNDGGSMGALLVGWQPALSADRPGLGTARSVLDTIAGLCGQALQRVQLSASTRQVADLAARLSASLTTAEATEVILSAAPQILGARLPAVVLPHGGTGLRLWHRDLPSDLAAQYADLTVDDPRPVAEAFRTGRRIVLADRAAFRARYPQLVDTAGNHGLTTTIAVPLLDPWGRSIAAIGMGWSRTRPLRPTDLALLDTITDLCQQTLERTRLAAAEHDLVTRLAGRVTTTPGRHRSFRVAVRYQPATSGLNLGGDWYDVSTLADGRLAVIVGDVVGHQIEAAADMAQLRTVLNTLVRLDTPPAEVFFRVTTLLGRGLLGTALIAWIDPAAARLELVRAGHPYPVVIPAGGTPKVLDTPVTPPLGMVTAAVSVVTAPFGVGDTFVAFTDGLVERRSRAYDDGVADLCGVLADVSGREVDTIADTVLSRIPRTDDDRALVVIRSGLDRN